ncbi:hypothetical protein ACWN8V_07280 [Vagococcus elongatus]|uniref:Uncharacterized protein n=1 Tax=Vagococcus elongatus TaxID=180344 RepID=A0A430AVV1_9ENTE|nr:hypothetical protein [Vagococcus elongatus]RSU12183.1 hypothetical protein CBF29_06175 [Vagococcus elongatus]
MAQVISTGQITIVDLYDAPALNAWISSSQTTRQTYNNTTLTYSPNYATTPQKLTLNLTRAGGTGSLLGEDVSGVKWTKIVGDKSTEITSTTEEDIEFKGSTNNSVLTTKTNVPTANNAIIWKVEGIWTDPNTSLPISFQATIDLTLVQLAKASIIPNVYAPNGDFFRNNTPSSLKVNCDLYKDGSISSGNKKFKWFAADSKVVISQDADAGVGWRKITAITGTSGETVNTGFDVSTTSQGVLTVFPDAVINSQTYLVVLTDSAGGTSGQKVKQYITLKDMDDPIMTTVESTNGNILKNGSGSTILTARLFQNGEEIDSDGKKYTYKWTKWEDGKMIPTFGGAGTAHKLGKSLTVGNADVNSKANFKVEVEA